MSKLKFRTKNVDTVSHKIEIHFFCWAKNLEYLRSWNIKNVTQSKNWKQQLKPATLKTARVNFIITLESWPELAGADTAFKRD